MNVATEIVGERIARRIASRAEASEALLQRERSFTIWQYLGCVLMGGAAGFFTSQSGHVGAALTGITAGAAFFLAAAAFRECLNLRRKLAAVIVLLEQNEPR